MMQFRPRSVRAMYKVLQSVWTRPLDFSHFDSEYVAAVCVPVLSYSSKRYGTARAQYSIIASEPLRELGTVYDSFQVLHISYSKSLQYRVALLVLVIRKLLI